VFRSGLSRLQPIFPGIVSCPDVSDWRMLHQHPSEKEPQLAEQMILVCDVCGAPARQSVTIRVGQKSYAKDLCGDHLADVLSGTRAPKRGRRPASALAKETVGNEAPAPSGRVRSKPVRRRGRTTKRAKTS